MKLIIIENQKIFDLNEKLKEKEKEIKKIRNENNRKYYSQTNTNNNTKFVEINNTSRRLGGWNKMLKILI